MELTEEEIDYNRILKGLVTLEGLEELKVKYKNVPYMKRIIKQAIKEQKKGNIKEIYND